MVLSDDSENANFAGVPDMGGFDMNGMAVNQQVVATSNVAANAAPVGLINLTNETT